MSKRNIYNNLTILTHKIRALTHKQIIIWRMLQQKENQKAYFLLQIIKIKFR